MKDLIKKIVSETNQKYIEFDHESFEFLFSYHEDIDDFYLFLFSEYDRLVSPLEDDSLIEFFLNELVRKVQKEKLTEFSERYLDLNLSCIVILKYELDDNLLYLKKAEENYITTKKYILSYTENSKDDFLEYLSDYESSNIVLSLNKLVVDNSQYLKSTSSDNWYILLLRLFVKIPFLNYLISEENKESLADVNKLFISSLNEGRTNLFARIIEDFNNEDVEEFLAENGYLNDE